MLDILYERRLQRLNHVECTGLEIRCGFSLAGSERPTVSDCGGETELLQTHVFFKSRTIHGVSLRKIDRH